MPCLLSVNLNKIALIRNARGRDYPSVVHFAQEALTSGAAGVTLHPRPDQRHARYSDIAALRQLTRQFPGSELNIEGYPDPVFLEQMLANKPHQCTLVPDAPGQLTSDHGWDLTTQMAPLKAVVAKLKNAGIRVSIFMDPDCEQIARAPDTGADRIELYTEAYARHPTASSLEPYQQAAQLAHKLGLGVNAGHDLSLDNLELFVRSVPEVQEVSIGHALTVEALEFGFVSTIARYLAILRQPTSP